MALRAKNLKVYYNTLKGHVKALDDVSFTVEDGEILGIAGESGCGKSTLSNALIHLVKPMEHIDGQVYLDGKEIILSDDASMQKHRYKNISIIPQYALSALNPIRKIEKIVQDLMKYRGINYSEIEKKFKNRLEIVGLPLSVLKQYPIELSGGMKQRVVMVISTLLDPSLLICDEITSALDVTNQQAVAEMIVEFRDRKFVNSVTFVTHDVPVLYQIADRILIMYAGQLAEIGTAEEIIHQGRHPYTRALVESMPEVGHKMTENVLKSIPGRPPALLNPPEGCRFKERCPLASEKCNEFPPETVIKKGHRVYCWEVS